MTTYTNLTGVPLSLAVYLANDTYDHDPNAISATALIKPVRQLVLRPRVPKELAVTDVLSLVKSRLGTSIHDGIERAWVGHYREAMLKLGYPEHIIDKVVINPDPDNLPEGAIPVYMEQRMHRQIGGVTVSGKYDFIAEGRLEDFKSTSTYTWVKGVKDEDHQLQGSIYRWLGPKIITEDYMVIQYIFTDWKKGMVGSKGYPTRPVEPKKIPLLSLDDTEEFIVEKLHEVARYRKTPEPELPLCSDRDLWRTDPVYRYFSNPAKTDGRSTKNFDTLEGANAHMASAGKGIVITKPGQVRACVYCPSFPVCTQKDQLIADGSLVLDD